LIDEEKSMKYGRIIAHALGTVAAVFLLAVLPALTQLPLPGKKTVDAVSSASLQLPEQPSGAFYVLLKTSLHTDTLDDWRQFFTGESLPVIFEDIRCAVAEGDASGVQLAERFQAQLPENQMRLRTENPTLLVSKIEAGRLDVAVLSREMAEALKLQPETLQGVTVFEVTGGEAQ